MTKAKKPRPVEIDDRLTNLFTSRRNGGDHEGVEDAEVTESTSADMSWLNEFRAQTSSAVGSAIASVDPEESNVFRIDMSEVRPFWSLEERGSMISLWKKSKTWLAKDCQKQRKAALRKTSRK